MSTDYIDPSTVDIQSKGNHVFEKRVLIGTDQDDSNGNKQFDLRKRLDEIDGRITDEVGNLPDGISGLEDRLETIETVEIPRVEEKAEQGISGAATAQTTAENAVTAAENASTAATSVRSSLTNHINDKTKHLPAGGQQDDVLVQQTNGNPTWTSFLAMLPPDLINIVENGGNVTPEQVIEAFQQITVKTWRDAGRPFPGGFATVLEYLYDRFVVGGSGGAVNYNYEGQTWRGEKELFTEPVPPAAVEDVKGVEMSTGGTLALALDAYSDYRVSLDRIDWNPRMSVRVKTDANGNYLDRFDTADFVCAAMDREIVCLFTTKGTVYRTTYAKLLEEYEAVKEATDGQEEGQESYDRLSTIWQMQSSQESFTSNALAATAGGNYFVMVGALGKIAYATLGEWWTNVQSSPFGTSNINAIASGDDRWVAVADNGRIGYALFSDPGTWRLIDQTPFGTESVRAIHYSQGMWLAGSASGKIFMSKNSLAWTEVEAGFSNAITDITFGSTFFLVSDDAGNVRASLSVSSILTLVSRSEFAQLADEVLNMTAAEIARVQEFMDEQLARINEALAKQLVIADAAGQESTLYGTPGTLEEPATDEQGNPVEDENGNPVMVPQTKTLAYDHTHPTKNLVLLSQLARASYDPTRPGIADPIHYQGVPVLDEFGRMLERFNTWIRGEENGIAPLDENKLVPAANLAAGWKYEELIRAIRDQMLIFWTIQGNTIFQDLGESSRINAMAHDATTIVAVGERGRIAWGPNIKSLQMVVNSPFGQNDSVVGVAQGTKPDGESLFVAVSQTHYSTSLNGEVWTEAVELSQDIQGVFFGGGYFLVVDASGNIWRSDWDSENRLSFLAQETSRTITQGTLSIAYLENKFVGVGAGNKIVGAADPAYWNEEQSPAPPDTQWNGVFAGNGFFVIVGNYGRAAKGTTGGDWQSIETETTTDLHFGMFDGDTYLVTGKNGLIITSFDTDSWVSRDSKTTSTIRCAGYKTERFYVGTDAGQFIASASIYDVLMLPDDGTGSGPSNDDPLPDAKPATPGTSNKYSRTDHQHPFQVSDDEPKTWSTPPAPGEAETYARSDHQHPDKTSDELPRDIGPEASAGDSDELSRVDHVHSSNGLIRQEEKGIPGGVAPLDLDNLVPMIHVPPIDLTDLLNSLQANLEFVEVVSPFPQGIGVSSVLHAGCSIGEILSLGGEAGIGYSNGGATWHLVENQPFDAPVVGMAAGLNHDNEMTAFAIDTQKSFSTSRDLVEWSEKTTLDGNYDFSWVYYYNKTWVITSTNGQILRSVWNGMGYDFAEQEDGPEFTEGVVRTIGGNGQWIGFGLGGRIRRSTDASHFSPVESPIATDLYCGDYGNGIFVLGGENGTIVFGNGSEFEIGTSPFGNEQDVMSITFIKSIGMFLVTNRIGEIAAVDTPRNLWVSVRGPFAVAVRAVATSEKIISIGNDRGEIASSRKVVELGTAGTTVLVGEKLAESNGFGIVQLCGVEGLPTGEIYADVLMLPVPREASESFAAPLASISSPANLDDGDAHSTGWGDLTVDQQLDAASADNPANEVELT